MPDYDAMQEVCTEIITWQFIAQQMPLPQLGQMYDNVFTGLAAALDAFNTAYRADAPDPDALVPVLDEVMGRALAAAIFALGMNNRLPREAALN